MIKKEYKISKKILTLLSLLLIMAGTAFYSQPAQAYEMEVGIPDTQYDKGDDAEFTGDTSTIGNYIKAIYSYGIGIVGILAAVVLMIGGVIWLTAGGNVNKVETAKQWIGGALTGLVLALTSYMLLYQINPELVQFRVRDIDVIDPVEMKTRKGCCEFPDGSVEMLDKKTCESEEYGGADRAGDFIGYDYEKGTTKCIKKREYSLGGCLYDWDSEEQHWTNCVLRDEHGCKEVGDGFFDDCKNEGENNEVCSEFCGYDKVCDDNWGEDFCVPRE